MESRSRAPNTPEDDSGSSLLARILDVADERPGSPALIVAEPRATRTEMTWASLARHILTKAMMLRSATPDDAVVIVRAANDISGVVRLISVLASGRAAFPVEPEMVSEEVRKLAEGLRKDGSTVIDDSQALKLDKSLPAGDEALSYASRRDMPAAGSYIIRTGGTTGPPKLIRGLKVPSCKAGTFPSRLLVKTGWRSGQVQLLAGALCHAGPFHRLLDGILSGNTIILIPEFQPEQVARAIATYSAEWAQFTPIHMSLLEDVLVARTDAFQSLRGILHTAAPCPHGTKRTWIRCLGGERIWEMYAASEGIGTALCDGTEWLAHPGTVGKGFFTRIRIYDDDGNVREPGGVGRIYMRSVRSDLAQAATIFSREGFASVGDRGYLDDGGYLYLAGRERDFYFISGVKVSAFDAANALFRHDGIRDATVVAVRDADGMAKLAAMVVPARNSGLTEEDVISYCRQVLPSYAVPADLKIVEELPRSAAGKLERKALDALARDEFHGSPISEA